MRCIFISNVVFKLQLQFFVKCRGVDVKNTTYTIMAHLMSNDVAMLYSWTGAKEHKNKLVESPFRKTLQSKYYLYNRNAKLSYSIYLIKYL